MKLEYKILWFEDDEKWYKTIRRTLQDFLIQQGFVLVDDRYFNGENGIRHLLGKKVYDLILMDYNLKDIKGDSLIKEIRLEDLYTEIVFYSTSGAKTIRKEIRDADIDGLYCTSRDNNEFEDSVFKIILNTVKKVQDVNYMRGLVIAETIDLETTMEGMLKKYFYTRDGEELEGKRSDIYTDICSKKKAEFDLEAAGIGDMSNKTIKELIDQDILTSYNFYTALQSILKEDIKQLNRRKAATRILNEIEGLEAEKGQLTELKEELNKFGKEIIELRNTLAHVVETETPEGLACLESLTKAGIKVIFTNEKYVAIRNDIRKHSINLSKIDKKIFPEDLGGIEAAASHIKN